jgi:hypothetical protein
MSTKKKLVWYGASTFGKSSKSFWKAVRKSKSKQELKDALYVMAIALQEVEGKVYELKKFIGSKYE